MQMYVPAWAHEQNYACFWRPDWIEHTACGLNDDGGDAEFPASSDPHSEASYRCYPVSPLARRAWKLFCCKLLQMNLRIVSAPLLRAYIRRPLPV
jgi:hypothetical protein